MPGLPETMYGSEQINIPPSFPYLLRQYAKAAIRSQPTDLLQWSTAYFRCLSLNIPPPVKARLEYPIPRDYLGITPGWLKALLYQLPSNKTIHFKILWDRWTGACLSHNTLIRMLCLGRFTNHKAIPWMRFIGLCAAHLTDDLTGTMKLICEIVTEEPEGGSAMIPYEIFMDLYVFLAKLDASKPQILKNVYFSDSLLDLYTRVSDKDLAIERTSEIVEEEESEKISESIKSMEIEVDRVASKEEVSCPSLGADDHYSVDYYMEQVLATEQMEEEMDEIPEYLKRAIADQEEEEGEFLEGEGLEGDMYAMTSGANVEEEGTPSALLDTAVSEKKGSEQDLPPDQLPDETGIPESVETITGEPRKMPTYDEEDMERVLIEDLERLKALQQEIPGEMDEEVEKYKCRLIAEMPLTPSQEIAIEQFKDEEPQDETLAEPTAEEKSEEEGGDIPVEPAEENLEIWIDVIPGIGPVVSDELIAAVQSYMKNVSVNQHNMVMPRNIRHYSCPPLEIIET